MTDEAVVPAAPASGPTDPASSALQTSLVGDSPDLLRDSASKPEPTTGTEVEVESPDTPTGELSTSEESGEELTEDNETETADDWLPTEQEKEFPFATLAKFAEQRYGVTEERLKNDPALQLLVKDKLNGDIFIKNKLAAETASVVTGDELDEEVEPVQLSPEETRKRYYGFVDYVRKQTFDPAEVANLGKNLYAAFGLDLSNPEDPDTKAALANAPKVGAVMASALVDGVYSALPTMLLSPNPISGQPMIFYLLETAMPGISEMWERTMYSLQWERVRMATRNGQIAFPGLPAFGTPEFRAAIKKAGEGIPNFDDAIYKDKDGRELPLPEQAYNKYLLLARFMTGKKTTPAEAEAAFKAGKKTANSLQSKRNAGKAMGAGGNRSSLDPKPSDDPLDAAIAASNDRANWMPKTTTA